jgi:MoCo/4Fe-4S cofactor protein with predicted Tat translocation signal
MSHRERAHWRSLEELADAAGARTGAGSEFAPGAQEPPEEMDRRTLVQLLGATLSLAGLAACRRPVEHIVPFVTPPEEVLPGIAKRYATTMPAGLGGNGLLVTSREGRPTKIEGNELHPATRGRASARMQAALLALYDPDRSRQVLQRTGADATAESRTWSDFVAAWQPLAEEHLARGGEGLAVLAPPSSSPTLFRLAAAARERFPRMRWATWEPVSDERALAGVARLAGRPLRPVYDLETARVILSLDADLLLGEGEAVAHARGFAAGRRPAGGRGEPSRLWVVESALSTTGAMADERLALASSRVGACALALAVALERAGIAVGLPPGLTAEAPAGVSPRWLAALARDLVAQRGASVVVAGRDQPPAVHALALAINAALGNLGTTLTLRAPVDLLLPSIVELAELTAAMHAGDVSTLLLLGGNPVYDAPADLAFAAALARVATVVHLGPGTDETAARAHWHLPEAHFLEAWGDCRAADGTASVVQPLIAPLFGGRSALELLGLVASGAEVSGHDEVRTTWSALLPEAEPGAASLFDRVLHDGLLPGSATPPVVPELSPFPAELVAGLASGAAASSDALELVLRPSPAVFDGRYANVGWLQELPDPLTKLTWGNAALLAPGTAARLGLRNEEGALLRLAADTESAAVELPVWIVPGQAEGTVVVDLGYGRRAAGRIGTGVGVDVYPLRRSASPGFVVGATLERSGRRHRLAATQEHGRLEGRTILREATLAEWRREPGFAGQGGARPPEPSSAADGPQWALAIDLDACTGCNACVVACQSENNVPVVGAEQVRRGREMHWLRIDRYFSGPPEAPEVSFQPVPCMHCEEAPCEPACPVGATVHTEDGLNAMVYNRCVGARSCAGHCPYKVRRFNFFDYGRGTPKILELAANPEVTVRTRGVMEKCTYCVQRIQAARIDAKLAARPLAEGDVRTACQQTCPTEAIVFGDLSDPESLVSRRRRDERAYLLLGELGLRPRTSYLARLRNPHPELGEGSA